MKKKRGLWIKKPIICKGCKEEIKGNFGKYSYSFDLYHPRCMKKSEIKMVYFDEASTVDNKIWKKLLKRFKGRVII